jgi:hypothetical protein
MTDRDRGETQRIAGADTDDVRIAERAARAMRRWDAFQLRRVREKHAHKRPLNGGAHEDRKGMPATAEAIIRRAVTDERARVRVSQLAIDLYRVSVRRPRDLRSGLFGAEAVRDEAGRYERRR